MDYKHLTPQPYDVYDHKLDFVESSSHVSVQLVLIKAKFQLDDINSNNIPVTSTTLECVSPTRFARMGVENKGTTSRTN